MEILEELTKLKGQVAQLESSIDRLIAQAVAENPAYRRQAAAQRNFERICSLTVPTEYFKGTKPTGILFADNVRKNVTTWKGVVTELLADCIQDERCKDALYELRGRAAGRTRSFIANTDEHMRSALNVAPYLFIETHYDTATLLHVVLDRILAPVGYDFSAIKVALKNE